MKILYVVKNLRVSNGVSSFVMNYYRQLIKKENINIDFLVISDVESPYYEEIRNNGGKIFVMPSFSKPWRIIKFMKHIFQDKSYDIVHSNVFNSGCIVAYYAKRYNVPVRILHSHATTNGDNIVKRIRNKPFQFFSIKFSNYLFACSKMAGKNIYGKKNYYVINNAIDLKKYEFDNNKRNEIRKEIIDHDEEKCIVATVGRLTMQKNPYFILDIIDLLKKEKFNFEFWWFGSGNLDEKIKRSARDRGIEEKIRFFGSVNDLDKYYSAMDIFILPSFYEGLPVVGVEAQVNGLKCIFSDRITDEIIISKHAKMMQIDDASIWKKQIIDNCQHNNRNEMIGSIDTKDYDIKKLGDKLYELYVKIEKEALNRG